MRRVKLSLPATVTNLGPGLNSLGLAVGLHMTIEFIDRGDQQLMVDAHGEGAGRYATGLRHPVVLGMMRLFQHVEQAPKGLNIRIDNAIPLGSGLGGEAAFLIAGVIGANNVLGGPLKRDALIRFAVEVSRRPDHTVTAMLGGLTASRLVGDDLTFTRLPIEAGQVVIVVPDLPNYAAAARAAIPETVSLGDALHNLGSLPLLIDALRRGDHKMLRGALTDRLIAPIRLSGIAGSADVLQSAQDAGASGVALCGTGPSLIAFAPRDHKTIAEAMTEAFADHDITARSWIVPLDTQGIVLSASQSE